MTFLGIPLYSSEIVTLLIRFAFNIFVLTIVIRGLYYPTTRSKDYLFTYYLIGITVFFICFKMRRYQLDMGMAFGLLAIFSILRYRTKAIPIKEMTYLFIVIGISVINSLASGNLSYAEMFSGNILIVGSITVIEKCWPLKNLISREMVYENLENITPDKYDALKADVEERTGISVNKIEVGNVDFVKGSAKLQVFYYEPRH